MEIYIVKGLNESESGNIAVISEFGVHSTLNGAKEELQKVIDEIRKECETEDKEIVNEKITDMGFEIGLDTDEYFVYEIIKREILE